MKCFYHQTIDAVALCKGCNRGLCPGCIAEVGLSSSCRNRCEADVATLNDLVERARTAYQKTSSAYFSNAVFGLLFGGVLLLLGGVGVARDTKGTWAFVLLVMGLLMAGWGASMLVAAKRFARK